MFSCRAARLVGSLLKGSLCFRCLRDAAMLDWLQVRRAVCSRGGLVQVIHSCNVVSVFD